jgi:acyl-CoA thioester hydrolase
MGIKKPDYNNSKALKNRLKIPLEKIRALPVTHKETIDKEYLDSMGHMNVRWYVALYDEATWHFFDTIGMTKDYFEKYNCGAFALRNFISYYSEIHAGEDVALHTRVLGRNDRRFHFMHFMVNETKCQLASTFESMGTHADLEKRRSAPFAAFIADAIDKQLKTDTSLDWDAPVCGILDI